MRDKAGRIKRKAMFAKLWQARYLRTENDAMGLAIGFAGRITRVARVHRFGERAIRGAYLELSIVELRSVRTEGTADIKIPRTFRSCALYSADRPLSTQSLTAERPD